MEISEFCRTTDARERSFKFINTNRLSTKFDAQVTSYRKMYDLNERTVRVGTGRYISQMIVARVEGRTSLVKLKYTYLRIFFFQSVVITF